MILFVVGMSACTVYSCISNTRLKMSLKAIVWTATNGRLFILDLETIISLLLVLCEVNAGETPVFVKESWCSLWWVWGAAGAVGRVWGQTGWPAQPAKTDDRGERTSARAAHWTAGGGQVIPHTPAHFILSVICDPSIQQGLCLKLQKEKQTLRADASQLRSSLADLKAYVQTLEERERLNPLPARPESRKTSCASYPVDGGLDYSTFMLHQ